MEGNQTPTPNVPTPGTPQPTPATPAIDYEKLDQIISNRAANAEKGVLKSYFSELGLEKDELDEAIKSFKEAKAQKANEQANKLTTLQQDYDNLKAQMLNDKLTASAKTTALEVGIDAKSLDYALKLVDLKAAVNEQGEIDGAVIKTALEKLVEDVPAFKAQQTQPSQAGFVPKVGTDNKAPQAPSTDDVLASIFKTKRR